MAPEEAECFLMSDVSQCLSCTVGNAGTRLWKSSLLVNDCKKTNVTAFFFSLFKKKTKYITHNATRDTEWHHWRRFTRLHAASSWATKGFTLLFSHMQPYSPTPVNSIQCVKLVGLPFKCSKLFHAALNMTKSYMYVVFSWGYLKSFRETSVSTDWRFSNMIVSYSLVIMGCMLYVRLEEGQSLLTGTAWTLPQYITLPVGIPDLRNIRSPDRIHRNFNFHVKGS